MENHHFQWENSLFLWPFSIAMLVISRGYHGDWILLDLSVSPTWRLPRCFNLALRISQGPSPFPVAAVGRVGTTSGETIAVRIVSGPENLLIIPTWHSQMCFKTVLPSMDGCQNLLVGGSLFWEWLDGHSENEGTFKLFFTGSFRVFLRICRCFNRKISLHPILALGGVRLRKRFLDWRQVRPLGSDRDTFEPFFLVTKNTHI